MCLSAPKSLSAIAIFAASVALSSCGGDLAKILPLAPGALATGVSRFQDTESNLIAEFQNDDRTLRYLSQGRYSCGYPTDPEVKKTTRIKNPKRYVVQRYEANSVWTASVAVIKAYSDYLQEIVDSDTADQATIKELAGAVSAVVTKVPATAPYGPAVAPVGTLIGDFRRYATFGQLGETAKIMDRPLRIAVARLESEYPTLQGGQQAAFRLWDECAVDKLNYLLQVSNPSFAATYGPNVGQSSGIELAKAYETYQVKRHEFRQTPDIKQLLDDILTQNEKLQKDSSKVTAQSLFNAGKDVVAAAEAAYGAASKPAASASR
jgi:hypothetical protein